MLVQQIVKRIQVWFEAARDVERVRFLDDHLLKDMGIKRFEIERRIKGR